MAPLPHEWKEEFARLRAERDELARMVARQNDRLDQVVSMLRRREAQLRKVEAEVRKLRRKLGLDDPEPEPTSASVPEGTTGEAEGNDGPTSSSSSDPDAPVDRAVDGPEGGGPSSTEPAGTAPEGDVGDGEAPPTSSSAPDGSAENDQPASDKKKPRPRSSGGRRPPPEHLPKDTEHHPVGACPHCGGRVNKKGTRTTKVYTVVRSYVRTRDIHREHGTCANPACNRRTTAPMPPMPCKRALYDCKFLAWLVVMKFGLLVPLDRIRLLLLSQGVNIAMGTLVHLIERAASLAGAIDGEHMKQLRRSGWMCFDGTGLKTLVAGQTKAWDGYLEVFTRDELTVFQFDMTKHADRLRERIRDFAGILVCDAETRNAAGAPGVRLANCNAHARRKLRDAERAQPHRARQGARFLQALYELEREADRQKLAGSERTAFRRRRSERVLYRFKQWLRGLLARDLPPSDPVAKAAQYYLDHFDGLTRFVHHGELPLDNNAAEREFQRHAKLRQASLFAGSPEGAHRWATLLGVVRTAQKCGVDLLGYLTWMFERRGTHRKHFGMTAAELTPMAYKAAGCPGAIAPTPDTVAA